MSTDDLIDRAKAYVADYEPGDDPDMDSRVVTFQRELDGGASERTLRIHARTMLTVVDQLAEAEDDDTEKVTRPRPAKKAAKKAAARKRS